MTTLGGPLGGGGGGGGGGALPDTDTLSNVDVLSVLVATEQTTRPTSALVPMFSVVLPIVVQFVPSAEADAVTVVPVRTRRNHAGGVRNAVPRKEVCAPAAERVMNS